MTKLKKIVLISLFALPMLTACGNKDVIGMTYTFHYATVKLPDGTLVNGKVESWARQDKTDSIRVTFEDGKGEYLTHASNVVLYNK
jgi:lipoprotein